MHRYALVGVAAGLVSTCPLSSRAGAQAAAAPLTLDAAVEHAIAHNPEIAVAGLRIDSARAEWRIARALPNPQMSVTPSNPTQYTIQLPLDIMPARHFRVKAADEGANAARLDLADERRQVVFTARQAFYDVLLADSLHGLASQQAETFRRLLAADSVRLRAGSIAERDVVTARLQLAHAEALLARAVVQQHGARLALSAAMGQAVGDTSMVIAGALTYSPVLVNPESLLAVARSHRPDFAAARERVSQSASALALARSELVPVPLIGGVYQPAQPFGSGSHVAPAIGLTIPILYAFGGERERARASLAAARVTVERTALQLRMDVTVAFDAYVTARSVADRYRCGLLDDASGALEDARYAYERGATALPDLLEAIRAYADTRADYLNAVHDYWVSLFALERAAGVDSLPGIGP